MSKSTKEQVLMLLIENPHGISGNEIGQRLFLVRNSIWKAIEGLRQDGFIINGTSGRGYQIQWPGEGDILAEANIRQYLHNNSLFTFQVHSSIDSTNSHAKQLAQAGAPPFTVVVAAEQTMGRGRMGRSFLSAHDCGVYISLILPATWPSHDTASQPTFATAGLVTAFAAVAACRSVRQVCGLECDIKWVNDLFVGNRKICGILTEGGGEIESGSLSYMVVGIGINTRKTTSPPELKSIITSVEAEIGNPPSRPQLIAALLDQFAQLESQLVTKQFMEEYRNRSNLIGRIVSVHQGNSSYLATAVDIDDSGGLMVEVGGMRQLINSGEVSVRL